MNPLEMTARQLAGAIGGRQFSAREAAGAFLDYIEASDRRLGSFLTLDREAVLARAGGIDAAIARGHDPGPLAGVPVAIKDNMCTRGVPTTCGSRMLEGFTPPYSATAVVRLEAAGAVVAGKTNLDEFAMGSSTENSAYGVTRNPWDRSRVPGGSSGGSAAAVSSGQVPLALGSDTGGSIRQPAAFTGITGFKPTYGRVSRYGLVAFASSLDQIGPMARTADDCALVMGTIAGHDPLDSTSADLPWAGPDRMDGGLGGVRVGVVDEYMGEGIDSGVRGAVENAIEILSGLGAEVDRVSLPHTELGLPAYYLIAPAEASSNLSRYDGIRYGSRVEGEGWNDIIGRTRGRLFGPEVRRRIMLGTYALSAGYYDAFYLKASRVRTLIRRDFDLALDRFDLLVGPTVPTVAFPIGDRTDDLFSMYMSDVLTIPVNLAGLPAVSVPCGLSGGMPVGLQIIGRAFEDAAILSIAGAYQAATDHHLKRPPFPGREDDRQ